MKLNKLLIIGLIFGGLVLSSCGKGGVVASDSDIKPDVTSNVEPASSEDPVSSEDPSSSEEDKYYTITWENYNGAILEVDENVKAGTIPTYDGPTPVRPEGDEYTYSWSGWDPEVGPVTQNEFYIATFDKVPKTYMSVTEAVELANQVGEAGTQQRQMVTGRVKNIVNSNYGEMYITDGTNDLYVYGVYSADGVKKYSELENKPYSGDEVFLLGYVKMYNGSPEMGQSWLQRMVSHQGEVDVSDYSSMNIAAARSAAKGSKVLIQGVVATITYANGKVPSGIYLVDDTSSIYVYNPEVAGRVVIGEEVKVAGVRDDYILESEISYANQWGYQGSIQLTDAIFVQSLGKDKQYLKSWIQESSMKALLETPLTNNITTVIYKVNAIVNKVPGAGFVNYYIDDLDNETGSYVYTLCNGGDFSHLDAFDGKICTVYLALHNAKSTKSGTVYRLMPIYVEEKQNFAMTDLEVANFALDYYAAPQFKKEYNADPALELLTGVSNEYIPFENVALSYESDSPSLVSFVEEAGKLVMHLSDESGEANITIKATYNGVNATKAVNIKIVIADYGQTVTVAQAIAASDDTEVTVKGIVMSSVVNQKAFYINDGTGVIAVRTSSETINEIDLGNEVVMKGTRTHVVKEGSLNKGQSCIDNAELVANLNGNHDFDRSTFITNKTFDEIFEYKNQQATVDLTTNVYVATCYLRKSSGGYSTNYYLNNGTTSKEYYLYAGSGSQYSDFDAFSDGRQLTVAFMLCDWNTKSEYRACIVYASDGATTVINSLNFK